MWPSLIAFGLASFGTAGLVKHRVLQLLLVVAAIALFVIGGLNASGVIK